MRGDWLGRLLGEGWSSGLRRTIRYWIASLGSAGRRTPCSEADKFLDEMEDADGTARNALFKEGAARGVPLEPKVYMMNPRVVRETYLVAVHGSYGYCLGTLRLAC